MVGPQRSSIAPRTKAISKAPFILTFARQPKTLRFTREENQSLHSPIALMPVSRHVEISEIIIAIQMKAVQ